MKILVSNYLFQPQANRLVLLDFDAARPVKPEMVLLVTNVTRNIILYNFASPGQGAAFFANELTFVVDCAGMEPTDRIQVFYEDGRQQASEELVESLRDLVELLKFLPAVRGTLGDLRVTPTGTVGISGSLTTLTTLTGQTNLGGFPASTQIKDLDNLLAVHSNINNII